MKQIMMIMKQIMMIMKQIMMIMMIMIMIYHDIRFCNHDGTRYDVKLWTVSADQVTSTAPETTETTRAPPPKTTVVYEAEIYDMIMTCLKGIDSACDLNQ